MARTAEGQAKLQKMLAAGMGRQQALKLLINAQKKTKTPQYEPGVLNPPSEGWNWDEERGGFTPPPAEEGTSVIAGTPNMPAAQREEQIQSQTKPVAAYNVYDDPFYQQALAGAQSQFNLDRINALAGTQYEERGIRRQLEQRVPEAEAERRRLSGNFARRGMAGGQYGALTRAEAEVNAREIGLRTGLREQIAELNRQFVSEFGAPGTDWLGTRRGSQAQQAAIQQALQNRLGGLTTVG